MLDVLHKLFAPSADAIQLDGRERAPACVDLPAAREELRRAHAARSLAETALRDAEATTERVRQLVADADAAERAAEQAAKVAADATRRWAIAGARGDMPADDAALVDAAMATKRHAEQLRLRADGAALALRELEAAERDARIALEHAHGLVSAAVGAVMLAAAQPDIEQLRRARTDYLDALERIRSLRLVASPRWGPASQWHRLASGVESGLAQVLAECAIPHPDERGLFERAHDDPHARRVAAWATALATDPSAECPW